MLLIADLFSEGGIRTLEEAKHEIVYNKDLSGDSLVQKMKELKPEVLVVRSTKVTKCVIDANPKLNLIIRAGAGTDTIDVAYASSKGIYVANCPGKNATAVAELTMGIMLNIDRRLGENYLLQKEGKWRKGMFSKCLGLKGRTLGLIGFGNIAQRVAKRALAFEMKVIAFDVFVTQMEGVKFLSSQEEVLNEADIVSLHVPNLPSTQGMVDATFLRMMKPNAVLINSARGELVKEEDLLSHLESNIDFWYGTDVLKGEPSSKECDWEHPLALHPRVYGSHHIGASTKQAEAEIGEEVVRICQVFSKTGQIDDFNWVNKNKDSSKNLLVIKAEKGAKTLAAIYTALEANNWEINSTESTSCKGGQTVILKINGEGPIDIGEKLASHDNIINVSVQ